MAPSAPPPKSPGASGGSKTAEVQAQVTKNWTAWCKFYYLLI